MNHRRTFRLFTLVLAIAATSLVCSTEPAERLIDLENQDATRVAQEVATIESRQMTEQAGVTPTPTETPFPPTPTPTLPPPTPTPTEAPTLDAALLAVLSLLDPSGDAVLCATGASIDDLAVDILTVDVIDPAAMGSDHGGWLLRVGLGAPVNETFENDWSGAVLAGYTIEASTTYTFTVNQTHETVPTTGTFDPTGQIIPGTESRTYLDDGGYVWFEVPRNIAFLQVAAFHAPVEDLTGAEKRCDLFPDADPVFLDLPTDGG